VPARPGWSHPSSPVPVRRPARVDGAASRPHLVVGALALFLAFGAAITGHEDVHLARAVPCLAHTPAFSRARLFARRLHALVRRGICQRARLRQRPTEGLPHDVLACEIIPCLVSGLTS